MTKGADQPRQPGRAGLTACGLCAGETLGEEDAPTGGQRARLERIAADGLARVTFVDCLDRCERGDVVVVRPRPSARRSRGARPVWMERLAGEDATTQLRTWLADGGPGVAALPAALHEHVIPRDGDGPHP